MSETPTPTEHDDLRALAKVRIEKKHEFHAHLLAYLLVNATFVAIWAVIGTGFFWPVLPIMGWGIGLAFHGWDTYRDPEPTEAQIEREIRRLQHT